MGQYKWFIGIVTIVFVSFSIINAMDNGYQNEDATSGVPGNNPNKPYTIHMLAHSHDDSGWLNTIEGYYLTRVKDILQSSTDSVYANPNRKMVWSEIGYLSRWWRDIDSVTANKFKQLVQARRIEFVNGGWVMSDEACTSAEGFIDNLEEGNRFIAETFGPEYLPTSGWQIDPFGHASKTIALETMANYKNIILHRVNTRVRDTLASSKDLEFIWRGGAHNNSEIFAHILDEPYWWPSSINLDQGYNYGDKYAINALVRETLDTANRKVSRFKAPHILLTVGGDFKYNSAYLAFQTISKTIDEINSRDTQYNVKFSTLSDYFNDVKKWFHDTRTPILHQYSNVDFMPYIEMDSNDNWVGYYTTNPILKKESRKLTNLQRVSEILHVQSSSPQTASGLPILRDTMRNSSFIQHHDAITGTHLTFVGDDYMARVKYSENILENSIRESTNTLALKYKGRILKDNQQTKTVVLYNPLAWNRKEVKKISFILNNNPGYCPYIIVDGNTKQQIASECIFTKTNNGNEVKFDICFIVDAPALSHKVYEIRASGPTSLSKLVEEKQYPNQNSLENSFVKIDLDNNGLIKSITQDGKSFNINQRIMKYDDSYRNGAYLFRPNGQAKDDIMAEVTKTFLLGGLVKQVRVKYSNNEVVITLFNTGEKDVDENIDISYTLPDTSNTDRIVRFSTNLANSHLYTDDGLEMKERPIMKDLTVTADKAFYPSVTSAYIKDDPSGVAFMCFSDRSKGAAAINQGNIEFAITRNSDYDDSKGLDYPSMPLKIDTVNHRCRLDRNPENYKRHYYRFNHQLISIDKTLSDTDAYSGIEGVLSRPLPDIVHLLTLKKLNINEYLVRLINIDHSQTASISVEEMFRKFRAAKVEEMYLSGAKSVDYSEKNICDSLNCVYKTIPTYETNKIANAPPIPKTGPASTPISNGVAMINPGEIKTFRFNFIIE